MTTTITGATGIDNIKAATGAVLQVVSVNKTDAFSTSSQSFVDITGLSATITPTSTSSKILVDIDYKGYVKGHGGIRLVRGSTPIYIGTSGTGNQHNVSMQMAGGGTLTTEYGLQQTTLKTLDSPSTASSVTYKVQGAVPHSAEYIVYCNRIHHNENQGFIGYGASSITLTEIAG
jgi:hypothetical protein